jgi:hypothetical protein
MSGRALDYETRECKCTGMKQLILDVVEVEAVLVLCQVEVWGRFRFKLVRCLLDMDED